LTPDLLHGEAVAVGMVKEAEIAQHLGHLSSVHVGTFVVLRLNLMTGRLIRCLQNANLPVHLHGQGPLAVMQERSGRTLTAEMLLDVMKVDKKNQGGQKRLVLLSGIGRTVEQQASFVSDQVIRKILAPAVNVMPIQNRASLAQHVSLTVPGSKSISNRALVLAALGSGTCRLKGLLHSDDTQVMLIALSKLAPQCRVAWEDDGQTLVIEGAAGHLTACPDEVYLGNAGTAARFLTTVCVLASPQGNLHVVIIFTRQRMQRKP
jgi:pentafunctional AROM polypeptide